MSIILGCSAFLVRHASPWAYDALISSDDRHDGLLRACPGTTGLRHPPRLTCPGAIRYRPAEGRRDHRDLRRGRVRRPRASCSPLVAVTLTSRAEQSRSRRRSPSPTRDARSSPSQAPPTSVPRSRRWDATPCSTTRTRRSGRICAPRGWSTSTLTMVEQSFPSSPLSRACSRACEQSEGRSWIW